MAAHHVRTWAPALAAGALLASVIVAGAVRGGDDGVLDAPTETSAPSTAVSTTLPGESGSGVAAMAQIVPLTQTLGVGSTGPEVERVQRRLIDLAFDPGLVDGVFGTRTLQAVWAFEKLVMGVPRQQAQGRVTPEMWDRMQRSIDIAPRRPEAATRNHTEIYLPEQVLVIFHDRRPVLVTHISSGDDEEWCEEVTISPGELGNERGTEPILDGVCGRSVTPGGVFRFYRRVEGRRESQLGGLYNPVYFNFGIAVHGAHEVPAHPASHGCIRIPMHISDYYQGLVTWGRTTGDVVYVFDGVKEPEEYGAQSPVWNWSDPDYSTTTTSTTTTTTSTTSTTTTTTVVETPPATTTAPEPVEPDVAEPDMIAEDDS
jgi:hypothetical protein